MGLLFSADGSKNPQSLSKKKTSAEMHDSGRRDRMIGCRKASVSLARCSSTSTSIHHQFSVADRCDELFGTAPVSWRANEQWWVARGPEL